MTKQRYSSGSRFEELAAYSRAVADDLYLHVSGTVGPDPDGTMPDDAAAQARNIFRILDEVLAEAGLGRDDVVRTRVYLTQAEALMPVAEVLREMLDAVRPANTTLYAAIPAPGAKVEIEFTARRRPTG